MNYEFTARVLIYSHLRDIIIEYVSTRTVTYKKLFHLMIDKGMSNAELMEQAGFSANIITRLKRDNYLSLDTIEKICNTLHCGVDDILEFIPNEKGNDARNPFSKENT